MVRFLFAGYGFVLVLGACASSDPATEQAVIVEPSEPSNFDLAMGTVDALDKAGNEQTAIDRLTQLLGDPAMSDIQMARALYRRAELRHGEGQDVEGAVTDLEELLADYGDTHVASEAEQLRAVALQERDMLSGMLDEGDLSAMERFRILFRLGRHQDAGDLMLAGGLEPDMSYILDMYQIGYLCDGDELAGPAYRIVQPDGAARMVQFCDLCRPSPAQCRTAEQGR